MTDDEHVPTPREFMEGWERTRELAKQALDRCQKAEAEAAYCRGEADALRKTCTSLEARNQKLTEEAAEFKMLLNDLGRRFLDTLQESKLSPYREPGAISRKPPNGNSKRTARTPMERIEPTTLPDPRLEDNLRELADQISQEINTSKKD